MLRVRAVRWLYAAALILFLLVQPGGTPVHAQDMHRQVLESTDPGNEGPQYVMDQGAAAPAGSAAAMAADFLAVPDAPTGSDAFGYQYSYEAATLASILPSATHTGLSETVTITNAVALPFSFPFYENTYNQVYISAYGFLTFTQPGEGQNDDQSALIDPKAPNNVVAPFWGPATLGEGSTPSADRVFYRTIGTAPNRSFVVQWNSIQEHDAEFTFQAVLEENGDIRFFYGLMSYPESGYYCTTSGIENARGDDGLVFDRFCTRSESDRMVHFTRPADSPRALISPAKTGQFATPGTTVEYDVNVSNSGTTGADVYEIEAVSSLWSVELVNANTLAPLDDTNSSGCVDTGSLAQGETFTIRVRVQVPSGAVVHDENTVTVTATSTLDDTKSDSSESAQAVPAPFVAGYMVIDDGIGRLDFIEPGAVSTQVLPGTRRDGFNNSVIETASGNIFYVWNTSRCLDALDPCDLEVWEIEYAVYNRDGGLVKSPTKLTDHSSAAYSTYDRDPVVHAAANGVVGIAWVRSDPSENGRFAENVYLQRLTDAGELTGTLIDLTQNTEVRYTSYFDTTITAVGDTRLAVAWTTEVTSTVPSGLSVSISAAGVDASSGLVVVPSKILAQGAVGGARYVVPKLTYLQGGNIFLAYHRLDGTSESPNYSLIYEELNQNLTQVFGPYSIDTLFGGFPDVVQLSSGRVLMAWQDTQIQYALLERSAAGYTITMQGVLPQMGMDEDMFVSVAADREGTGILSWSNSTVNEQHVLYYAAVNSNGDVLAGPMVYKTSLNGITTSYYGNTITSHALAPDPLSADLRLNGSSIITLPPKANTAAVQVVVANRGQGTAQNVTLTATWPATNPPVLVTSAQPAATCSATSCTWNLPDISASGSRNVMVYLRVTPLPFGEYYPIQFSVKATGTPDPDDTFTTAIYPALRFIVPYVQK